MQKKQLLSSAVAMALAALSAPALAADVYALGDETKGVTVKFSDEADLRARVRLQPRLDFGDLAQDAAGQNVSESDLYVRRARLEVTGHVTKALKYNLTLEGDKTSKKAKAGDSARTDMKVLYAYLDYKFADPFALRFGNAKLPYSRVSLTSSSRQLLVERPASTEAAKKVFGDYYQTNVLLHGKLGGGLFGYAAALADGANDAENTESDPYLGGRVVFSPPGWVEKGQSDAHLGKGRHLAFGLSYGQQQGQKTIGATTETDRSLQGADVSFHLGGLSAQAEYIAWEVEPTVGATTEPEGWYVQAGYLIPGTGFEPALRYEKFDRDTNAATDKEDTITTAGFNYYLKGHSMKIGVNWVRTELGAGNLAAATADDKRDVVQVQTQLYF